MKKIMAGVLEWEGGIGWEYDMNFIKTHMHIWNPNNNEKIKNKFSWDIVELIHCIILEIQF